MLCLRRRPPALGQGPCARGHAGGYGSIAHLQDICVAGGSCRPRPPRFPLRMACHAGGSLPRATKCLAGLRLPPSPPPFPAYRCARLVLQTARYSGQRSAWQVGAADPAPPLCAALGLSCRRLATAGNETLCLAGGSLPRATKRLAGEGCVLQAARFRGQ